MMFRSNCQCTQANRLNKDVYLISSKKFGSMISIGYREVVRLSDLHGRFSIDVPKGALNIFKFDLRNEVLFRSRREI